MRLDFVSAVDLIPEAVERTGLASRLIDGFSREQHSAPDKQAELPFEVVAAGELVGCTCRADALRAISERAQELAIAVDATALCTAFTEREFEGDTGLVDGFALPHAKCDAVARPCALVATVPGGIKDWECADDGPVTHIIALVLPSSAQPELHVRMVSAAARCLSDDDWRRVLAVDFDADRMRERLYGYLLELFAA